jgi:ABC-type multidrug transport system permease subunit
VAVGTLARKDLRLLLRDPRALLILLAMPLVLMAVLGVSLGEGFGRKPDDALRVSVVNRDAGPPADAGPFPGRPWAAVVIDDLAASAGVRVEVIDDPAEAARLAARSERACVVVFGPEFSTRVQNCSFLADPFLPGGRPGINPFFRDGVDLEKLDVSLIRAPGQPVASSIIEQVAQVTLLRVVMPWMIGRAFQTVEQKAPFAAPLLQQMFAKYNLKASTWAALTRATDAPDADATREKVTEYRSEAGSGLLSRGARRYQVLVPSYTVMFAFFLVLSAGWLFVAERRQGTMIRLKAAPVARWQVLLGKLLPVLGISLAQGVLLLVAGNLVFGMSWGPYPGWLLAVAAATSLAATGLAVLVGAVARTETQVAVYGTLLVLVLAGASGCLMPRDLMPEEVRAYSLVTPHAWALDAYTQLLLGGEPQLDIVMRSCAVLAAFGAGFLALAWAVLRLE